MDATPGSSQMSYEPMATTTGIDPHPGSLIRRPAASFQKGVLWSLFTEVKGVKYLNDKTHSAAWCNGCIAEWVRCQQEQDRVNVLSNTLVAPRSLESLRAAGES